MPNESLGKDFQIRHRLLYIKSLLHGIICITKCQLESKCFSFIVASSFFLLFTTFKPTIALPYQKNWRYDLDETSHVHLRVDGKSAHRNISVPAGKIVTKV